MNPKLEETVIALATGLGAEGTPTATPAIAETLGRRLAERLADLGATTVVVGDNPDDAVLGHVVARAAGTTLALLELDEGLLTFFPRLDAADRVVLVGYDVPSDAAVAAVTAAGAALVGVGSVVGADGDVNGTASIGLATAR